MFCRLMVCHILFAGLLKQNTLTTGDNINAKVAKRAGFLGKSFFVSGEKYQQPETVYFGMCCYCSWISWDL